MAELLTPEELELLRSIDTPTVCNAIETFHVRGRVEGFLGMDIRCLLPEQGILLGYAVTLTVDSTTPEIPQRGDAWLDWMQAMEASPKPVVLVFQDVGPQPRKSAHFGEVMGTLARRMGVVGIVTDGGVRDIVELKGLGLHVFAAGLAPSHGNPRLIEIGRPVTLDGVRIQPGDLVHGDANGVTTIPAEIAAQVAAAAGQIRQQEAGLLAYINSPEFTPEGLHQRRQAH